MKGLMACDLFTLLFIVWKGKNARIFRINKDIKVYFELFTFLFLSLNFYFYDFQVTSWAF